jgi:hypothetical protein
MTGNSCAGPIRLGASLRDAVESRIELGVLCVLCVDRRYRDRSVTR